MDGVTKTIETHRFLYDHVFDENDTNDKLYKYSLGKYIDVVYNGGILTCLAYGQTGSGKTYTMQGIESMAMRDLFRFISTKDQYDAYNEVRRYQYSLPLLKCSARRYTIY